MSENEPSSKKERVVHDSGRDRLSDLPLSIFHIILSSISTRDAVRMSILSKQFRYTWISLPHLVFNVYEFTSKECMAKFVTNALKLHKGPIHKFGLFVPLKQSWPNVDEWLTFLPRNEIHELILDLANYDNNDFEKWHQVRSIVYSCNKLTHLELSKCKLGPPPLTFTGFLYLRCLILVHVYIPLKCIESIVANSPLLETLKLDSCVTYDRKPILKITAPNLKYFYLESEAVNCEEIHLCAPLLVELCASMKYVYYEVFRCLEKLKPDLYFTQVLSSGNDFCPDSFVLHRLKVIELNDVDFQDVKHTSVVAHLVTHVPNLQMLELTCDNGSDLEAEEGPDVSYKDFLCATNFKWEKLKMISMTYLTGYPSEIEFLKILLENSPALERMNLRPSLFTFQEVKSLRMEILKCNLAAPDFTLWFSYYYDIR